MWWVEAAVFLTVSAAAFMALVGVILALSAPLGRPTAAGAGGSLLLIAISAGTGIGAANRFRAWGLRRSGPDPATRQR